MTKNFNLQQVSLQKQKAWKLLNMGQAEAAESIGIELYESGFADAELTYLLGSCQASLGSFSKAVDFFKESLTYNSDQANTAYTYIALGVSTSSLAQHDLAIRYYENAIKINPGIFEAYLGIGEACMSKGDFNRAELNYKQAISINPASGVPYFQLGHIEKKRDNGGQALKYFIKAVDCEPDSPDYQAWLSDTYLKMEFIEEAKDASTKALKLTPLNQIALGVHCAASARLGDYEEAIRNIDTALRENFLITDVALAYLTVCKHVNRCDEAIEYTQRCLSFDKLTETTKRNLHAQLALTLDYCERYDEAWQHITECKRYKFPSPDDYDPVKFKAAVDNIISVFTPANLFGVPSSSVKHDYTPIFIVGMPRSGTSLVEQILAGHSDVAACGELRIMNDLINEFSSVVNSDKSWPFSIKDLTQEQVDFLSKEYINRLPGIKQGAAFITDKMPHNFFALGLIQLLFPNAKIIHCQRQPLDTCISIYFANFHVGHEYSGNLFDTGAHYSQYLRLMEHWRNYLSIDLLEMDYEELVNAPEVMIKKLLDYCGLTWDENCLQFNKLKRNVKTASFDQVRQPIHTRSIDRWKHYDRYLDDLKSGLERGF